MTYANLEEVLASAHPADEYFPYVNRDFVLLGVLHRAQLESACARRRALWRQNVAACRSQMAAADSSMFGVEIIGKPAVGASSI